MTDRLTGAVPPVLTPLTADGEIDLERLVRSLNGMLGPEIAVRSIVEAEDGAAALAARNGKQATRALVDSHRILHAWLKRVDPVTGLLPHRGDFGGRQADGT